MSYIRSSSNPEALYIYGCEKNRIEISSNQKEKSISVPLKDWNGLLKQYYKDCACSDKYVCGRLSITNELHSKLKPWYILAKDFIEGFWEVVFPSTLILAVCPTFKERWRGLINVTKFFAYDSEFKWVLRYKGKIVVSMWQSTWGWIVETNKSQWERKR